MGSLIGNCYGGTISYCYNTGSVTGSSQVIGGLIGNTINSCTVNFCYNTGTVKATSTTDWTYLGGLVGQNTWSTISNSYNRGSVTSGYAPVGGLVGYNNTDGGVVINCYSTGPVSGYTGTIQGLNRLGGLIGDCCSGSVTNSYWDSQTAGTSAGPSGRGTAKTTAQMKTQSTYSGWDFTKVWEIVGGDGANYPTLRNVSAPPPPPTTSCGEQVVYAGKTYNTVKIGNQCWLKENLDVGTMIQITQNPSNNSAIEKYCYSNNSANCDTYGGLYQWNEAMAYAASAGAKGICPDGWHIPTLEEFQTLSKTVGDNSYALKAKVPVDPDATNTSGFTGLFGGLYNPINNFAAMGYYLYMWSSSQKLIGFPNYIFMTYITSNVNLASSGSDKDAFSIRCIKDDSGTDIGEERYQNEVPLKFSLEQNYPNPFNPRTKIRYDLPSSGNVKLIVYDVIGREVACLLNEYKQAGSYELEFNASGLSSGIYLYQLSFNEKSNTKRMILVK